MFKRDVIDAEVENLKTQGLIEKSDSPWSSQLVFVRKKDNPWRMCEDYPKLNAKTVKDAYPIPRIQDNLDSLNGAQWFTSLDCGMAYHQIPLEERDRPKTAFAIPRCGFISICDYAVWAWQCSSNVPKNNLKGASWATVEYLSNLSG